MKKIINTPDTLVNDMGKGLLLAHPELDYDNRYGIVKRAALNSEKVALISGGGSGHEPAHAGFIGTGMLDAAVCGDVFASPSQVQVYKAIKEVAGSKGVLLIIKNYSGDVMNFQNAAFMASEDGIEVAHVKVADDIAVDDSLYTVGKRGVAGTVLVHKVVGAAAEKGLPLESVQRIGQKAADAVKSIGFALTSCTVPAKGTPTFQIESGEMEYGVGIHGEPGIQREAVQTADELAERMVEALLDALPIESDRPARLAVLVNGFGGTPLQELYVLNAAVSKRLLEKGHTLAFVRVGNYMTSIDMAGASLSLMALDDELEALLGAPCETPAFVQTAVPKSITPERLKKCKEAVVTEAAVELSRGTPVVEGEVLTYENMLFLVSEMGAVVIENEVAFCELDAHAGDGDFGMSVAKGFKRLNKEWGAVLSEGDGDIGAFLEACALVIMAHCGGASGPIWGAAFRSAGRSARGKEHLDVQGMYGLLEAAAEGVRLTGERAFGRGAGIGDKTLMDALLPCVDAWRKVAEEGGALQHAFAKGAAAAEAGAKATENITARMGRAGTVGDRSLGYPDAGAHALGVIFKALDKALRF